MLRGIHKASANWIGRAVMGVILGLIAISFGIWGIGDIFRGFGTSTVAKVGGTEIRVDTFRQLYQDRLQQLGRQLNRPILPDQAKALGLDRQLLGEVIAETVLDERARALRLNVSDAEIARQITDMPGFKGITGQFDRARFDAVLRNMGYTEARFLAEQRRIALRQQLLGTVSGEALVPKTALEAFNRFQNEERTIDYVTLGPAQAGDIAEPTPEVLAKYFEERKVVFRAPEYRKITIVVLTPEDLASRIEISGCRSEEGLYRSPGALRDAGAPPSQADRVPEHGRGQGRRRQARPGHDLRGAGRRARPQGQRHRSRHGGENRRGRSRRRRRRVRAQVRRGQRAGPGPVRHRHRQGRCHRAGKTRPFEEVAAELKRDMQNERAKNELTNVQEKIEDERLGGATLADAARKFNLKPRVIEAIDRNGKDAQGNAVPDLPQNVDVLAAAFGADVHGENEPLRVPQQWRLCLVRRRSDHAGARPAARRGQGPGRGALARRRDRRRGCRAKATEMLDKIKAGTSFADVGGGRQAQGRMAAGHQARRPAGRACRPQPSPRFSRRRRMRPAASRAQARPSGSCFA